MGGSSLAGEQIGFLIPDDRQTSLPRAGSRGQGSLGSLRTLRVRGPEEHLLPAGP